MTSNEHRLATTAGNVARIAELRQAEQAVEPGQSYRMPNGMVVPVLAVRGRWVVVELPSGRREEWSLASVAAYGVVV